MSISDIARILKESGKGDIHRLRLTGYLESLFDLGYLDRYHVNPAILYRLGIVNQKQYKQLIGHYDRHSFRARNIRTFFDEKKVVKALRASDAGHLVELGCPDCRGDLIRRPNDDLICIDCAQVIKDAEMKG